MQQKVINGLLILFKKNRLFFVLKFIRLFLPTLILNIIPMRKILLVVFLFHYSLLTTHYSYSQDIHFSQFYASPLTLNPANTGNFRGDWRVFNNFRTQWKQIGVPFRTISLGGDIPFYIGKEKLSAGIIIVNDQSGDEKLVVNKFYASAAYHKTLGKSIFRLGIQGGYVMKSFNTSKLTFPNQFDKTIGEFNNSLTNNEKSLGDQTSYVDLNGGLIWSGNFGNFQPEIGVAMFHITQPKESFLGQNFKLPMRQVFHIGGKIDGQKIFFMPNILYMSHSTANDLLGGGNLGVKLPSNGARIKSVFLGPLFRSGTGRNSDAFIAIFGVNFMQLDVGVSYDVNISTLKTATRNRGAFEFSLIYTAMSTKVSKVTTPCERY